MAEGLARDTLARLLQQQQMQAPNAGFNAGQMPDPRFINPEPTMPTANAPPAFAQLPPNAPRPTPRGPTFDETLDQMIKPEQLGPLPPWPGSQPQWKPTLNAPFAGMEAFTWKDPSQQPTSYGTVEDPTPPREYLQMLQLLGRRRMPPEISGVGGGYPW